jgi:hypothetical protein
VQGDGEPVEEEDMALPCATAPALTRDSEVRKRASDLRWALELLFRPIPVLEPLWSASTPAARKQIEAFRGFVSNINGVPSALVGAFRATLSLTSAAADESVFRGVSTTILANARMSAPFTDCINEAHVPGFAARVTEAHRSYLAHVDKVAPMVAAPNLAAQTLKMERKRRAAEMAAANAHTDEIKRAAAARAAASNAEVEKLKTQLAERQCQSEQRQRAATAALQGRMSSSVFQAQGVADLPGVPFVAYEVRHLTPLLCEVVLLLRSLLVYILLSPSESGHPLCAL